MIINHLPPKNRCGVKIKDKECEAELHLSFLMTTHPALQHFWRYLLITYAHIVTNMARWWYAHMDSHQFPKLWTTRGWNVRIIHGFQCTIWGDHEYSHRSRTNMQPTFQFTSNFNMLQVLYPSCVVNSNRFESQHVSKHHFQHTLDLSFPPTTPLFFQSFISPSPKPSRISWPRAVWQQTSAVQTSECFDVHRSLNSTVGKLAKTLLSNRTANQKATSKNTYQQTHHPVLYETPPKTNIAPEQWARLEYYFPFEMVPFQMTCSFFWGARTVSSMEIQIALLICVFTPDCCVSHPSTNHITTIHGAKVHLTSCTTADKLRWQCNKNRLNPWFFLWKKHGDFWILPC